MKKLFVGLFLTALLPWVSSAAWFGPHVEVDYAQDASSMFYCASTGPFMTQAGVSVSSPPVSLFNPFGSGKNLTLIEVGVGIAASPAAAAQYFLAFSTMSVGMSNSGIQATVTPALIGKSTTTALGQCTVAGVLPAVPKPFRYIGGTTGASAIGGVVLTDFTNGKVVIPPGGLVTLQATSVSAVLPQLLWREDPQ